MSDTFRQAVEEIVLCSPCNCSPKGQDCELWAKCTYDCARVKAILTAHNAELDRIAHDLMATCEDFGVSGRAYNAIVKSIQAQKGS